MPLLAALNRLESEGGRGPWRPTELADAAGLLGTSPQLRRALKLLHADGMIDAAENESQTTWSMFVRGLTPEGMRALGEWPRRGQADVGELVTAINDAAAVLAPTDPDASGRLREFARFLGSRSADVGFELFKAWVKARLGIG